MVITYSKTARCAVMSLTSLICMGAIGGCNKPSEQAAKDADTQVVEQPQTLEKSGGAGGDATHAHPHHHESGHDDGAHHHGFKEPEKYAVKWNDPERDTWQHPEEIIAAMGVESGHVVVDIGAGTGYMVAHLSKAVGESGEVMALDVEESMVKYIAARKEEFGPAKILPRKVSSDSPALKPSSVHAVMTLNTWHHIARRDAYVAKVYTGLKSGGKFVVVDFELDAEPGPPAKMRLSPEQVINELEEAGFVVEQTSESMPRHYMVVGTKP